MITRKLRLANLVEAAENIADKRNQGLRLEIDNSAAERTLRAVALGRNYVQRWIMSSPVANGARAGIFIG
jgi:hypothetical protein